MSQTLSYTIDLKSYSLAAIAAQLPAETDEPEIRYLFQQQSAVMTGNQSWTESLRAYIQDPSHSDRILLWLVQKLSLTPLEMLSLALVLAVEEDALTGRAIAKVQAPLGGSRPTLGLLATALGSAINLKQPSPIQTLVNGTAMQSGLLTRFNEGAPLPEQVIGIPTHLSFALKGYDSPYGGTTIGLETGPPITLSASIQDMAKRHGQSLQDRERTLIIRTGSEPEGRSVATEIASALAHRPLFIQQDLPPGLGPWLLLRQLLPVFCFELTPGDRKVLPAIPFYHGPTLVICGHDGNVESRVGSTLSWTIPVPDRNERLDLWAQAVGDRTLAATLAHQHRHRCGRIAQLGVLAQHQCQLEGRDRPTAEDVAIAAWNGEGVKLDALAQPLPERIANKALVMTTKLHQDLNLLLLRCRARDGLVDGLGTSATTRYYPGVRALFVGPSGTGKTLAVSWLATQLEMPLYRVDLASVNSKYIGETEKNLAQLLDRAEQAEVVLLFDEADSLFGKRTDVQQANDRFANAQTNYLLQRIETFDGIAILTSNSRNRFDAAFSRRLDAVLEFPLPGPQHRKALWLAHLGSYHQLTTKDLNQLAFAADLTGGNIRNVVLSAAVVAQQEERAIAYSDILQGLESEYLKLGQPMSTTLKRHVSETATSGQNPLGAH